MKLPNEYKNKYAGKHFTYDGKWFCQKECDYVEEFDDKILYSVIHHETAQFDFAIDSTMAIYVAADEWVKLFNSIEDLVNLSNFESNYVTNQKSPRENLGYYQTIKEFEESNKILLEKSKSYSPDEDGNNKLYIVDGVPIYLAKTYDQEHNLVALKGN